MPRESFLLSYENGKRFLRYAGYIPRPVLQRLLFGTAVFRAIRESKPAVWRPLATAALGDALIVKTSPKRIMGYIPDTLPFDGEEVETHSWFVLPGDWDINPKRLEEHESYPRMRALLSGDLDQTVSYKELITQEERGELPSRVKKLGDGTVKGYFSYYRALADKIAETRSVPNFGDKDKDKHIGIAIGRHGQIVHQQKGHHRAIIAQFVPCDTMEAKILAVHPLWVKKVTGRGSFADAIKDGIALLGVQ